MTCLVCFRLHLQDMPLQVFVVVDADLRLEERSFFVRQTVKAGVCCNHRHCCDLKCNHDVAQQPVSQISSSTSDVIRGIVLPAPFCILFTAGLEIQDRL
jgi:hypothetical protein